MALGGTRRAEAGRPARAPAGHSAGSPHCARARPLRPLPCRRSIILYILVGVGAIACGVIYYQMIDSIVSVANGSSSGATGSLCSSS